MKKYIKSYSKLYETSHNYNGKIAIIYDQYDYIYRMIPAEFYNEDEYGSYKVEWANSIQEAKKIIKDLYAIPAKQKDAYYVIYDPYSDVYTLQTLAGIRYLGLDNVVIAYHSNILQDCLKYITK